VGELISAHPGESEFQSMLDIDNAEKIDTAVSTAAIMILHTRYEWDRYVHSLGVWLAKAQSKDVTR